MSMTMVTLLAASLAISAPAEVITEKIPGSMAEFKLAKIPAGKVRVGGVEVEVKPFYMGVTEVTWDTYDIFAFRLDLTQKEQAEGVDAKARPSKPYGAPDKGYGHKGFAALCVHSNAAKAYCEWLSKKTGKTYRLPTEAEWVYAATADGKAPTPLTDYACFWDNSDDQTMAVGSKKPNSFGLYDTLGNVCEWTLAADGTYVTRGGNYTTKAKDLSIQWRKPLDPVWQQDDAHVPKSKWWLANGEMVGFRVVMEAPAQ